MWCIPVILVLALLKQENCGEFEASLIYSVRFVSKKKTNLGECFYLFASFFNNKVYKIIKIAKILWKDLYTNSYLVSDMGIFSNI